MKILNLKQIKELTSLSVATIWRKERKGEFPSRRQITENRVGWVEEEILSWLNSRQQGVVAPSEERQNKKKSL